MRSAALFEADNERRSAGRTGRRPDARRVSQARPANAPARDELIGEDPRTPGTEDGRNSGKKSWFLHDDRDREELDMGPAQRRAAVPNDDRIGRSRRADDRTGGVSHDRASSGAPAEGRPSRWEYVDPKGNIQGPFPASDLVKWANGGFFSADQKVRRAGQQAFVPLKAVLPQLNREAEGKAPPPPRRAAAAEVNGRAVREDAPVRRAVSHLEGRPREQRPGRSAGYQGLHPADALLSPEETAARARNAQPAGEGEGYAPRDARGGRGVRQGFEPAGRGGLQGFPGRGRGGGRGDGYGRGGRGQGAVQARAVAVGDTAEARLPFSYKIAQKLFMAEAELATEEPMWRYIDPSGTIQGPFPARNMLDWYRKGMLHDMGLQVCGAERKVAPPDVPLPIHYHKLGDLLESVKRGQRFAAVSVPDIRSGTARPLLSGKAPKEDVQASAGARKADAPKAGKRKGGSASRPAKAAVETVSLKLVPVESGDGVTVELTVLPPAHKPQEATVARDVPASGAAAQAPAAKPSIDGAAPATGIQAGEAAKSAMPVAAAALPDTLLPEIKDSAVESAPETAAEEEAADSAVAPAETAAAGAEEAPDAASKAAPGAAAPIAAAVEELTEEPVEPKADSAPEAADPAADAAPEAPEAAPVEAADEETRPADAADKQAAAAEAAPEEPEASKEADSGAAAEPLKEVASEAAPEKSATPAVAKVEEVQAVLASNVSAVVAADTVTADNIDEDPPATAQQKTEDAVPKEDTPAMGESSSTPADVAEAAPAEEPLVAQSPVASAPAKEINGIGGAAEVAEAAEPAEDKKAEVEDAPAVETKEAPSKAEDAGQSEGGEEAAGAKEGPAVAEATASAGAEKPKQHSSMFKSAMKMFQGK